MGQTCWRGAKTPSQCTAKQTKIDAEPLVDENCRCNDFKEKNAQSSENWKKAEDQIANLSSDTILACDKGAYIGVNSGASCESNNYEQIQSVSECEKAASELGLSATHAGTSWASGRPNGCQFSGAHTELNFKSGVSGTCGGMGFECICKVPQGPCEAHNGHTLEEEKAEVKSSKNMKEGEKELTKSDFTSPGTLSGVPSRL